MPRVFWIALVGILIHGFFRPASAGTALLYLAAATLFSFLFLHAAQFWAGKIFRFKGLEEKILGGLLFLLPLNAVIYLASVYFLYSYKEFLVTGAFLLLYAWPLWKTLSTPSARQDLRKNLRSVTVSTWFLAFSVALLLPHLALGVREDIINKQSSSTRASLYQPDSRIPFHLVQILNNGLKQDEHGLLGGWPLRAPLLGLNTGFFTTLLDHPVPKEHASAPFTFFDQDGFWIHRMTATLLSSCLVFLVFIWAQALNLNPRAALLAALFCSVGVFVVTNFYFTWGKMLASVLLLYSAYLGAFRRKFILAGLAFALAYMSHGMAVLYLPGVFLYLILKTQENFKFSTLLRARNLWVFVACVGLFTLPWIVFDTFFNFHAGAKIFYSYPFRVHPGNPWYWQRIQSLYNTLFPYGFSYYPHTWIFNDGIASVKIPDLRPRWYFYLNYCNTLPGALGLFFFPFAYYAFFRKGWPNFRNEILGLFVLPLLCMTLYWGDGWFGMMKELGQGLLLLPLLFGMQWVVESRPKLIRILWTSHMVEFYAIFLFIVFITDLRNFNFTVMILLLSAHFVVWQRALKTKLEGRVTA